MRTWKQTRDFYFTLHRSVPISNTPKVPCYNGNCRTGVWGVWVVWVVSVGTAVTAVTAISAVAAVSAVTVVSYLYVRVKYRIRSCSFDGRTRAGFGV